MDLGNPEFRANILDYSHHFPDKEMEAQKVQIQVTCLGRYFLLDGSQYSHLATGLPVFFLLSFYFVFF
jgi:hypothetical protein